MNRFIRLLGLLAIAACGVSAAEISAAVARPNILVFLVDDMGWQDTSVPFHAKRTPLNEKFHTPNMERLAASGVKFTQAYACSVCSPSRVSLITGMNAARHRVTNWTLFKDRGTDAKDPILAPPAWNVNGVCTAPGLERAVAATTLPMLLREAGYRTIHVGKAHFGAFDTPGAEPKNLGFDVNIAGHAAGGPGSYLGEQNFSGQWRRAPSIWDVPGLERYHGQDMFLTEALTIEAKRAMDQAVADGRPFFLYMAHYAVHVPYSEDKRFYQKYRDAGLDHTEAMYAALVEGMDKSLGDLLANLDRHGIADQTVVLFMSDNGGLSAHVRSGTPHTHNAPLSSGKGSAREGGIRVPMIVRWPGVTAAASTCDGRVIIEDFFPTILEMAGLRQVKTRQPVDGVSFVPLLRREPGGAKDRALVWHYPNHWGPKGPGIGSSSTIRKGDWKLIYYHADQRYELFNLADDLSETRNLAGQQPQRVASLAAELGRYLKSVGAQMPIDKRTGNAVPLPGTPQPSSSAIPPWTRPIRLPEGIALTRAEPPLAMAGETTTLRIPFTLAKDVPAGSALRLQLFGGRNNKGVFFGVQTNHPRADGYVTAETDHGRTVSLEPTAQAGTYVLPVPPGGYKKGQAITVVLGDRRRGGRGVRVGGEHIFNKFFVLYNVPSAKADARFPQWAGGSVWAKGTDDRIVAACTMHILGGATDRIRAYVPAVSRPGRPLAVLVRPEDKFGNLSHEELGSLALSLGETPLGGRVEKVPGSNCVRVAVTLPAEGVHRLEVCEIGSGRRAVTNPTRCSSAAPLVCWGMIHGHTELSDGTGHIDDYFRQLKDEVQLDFAASADHDHLWETPNEFWAVTCQAVKRWNKPQEFVALLGYEWAKWRQNGDGDRNVYYADDDRPMYRSDDSEYPSPPELFAALRKTKEKALVIVHHPAHGGNFCDWKDHSPEHERLVEIHQTRGSFECSAEDGNPLPEAPGKQPPYAAGYVRNALALGWRVGFTGGGDDHGGHWGTEFRFGKYKQGLMSIEAAELTRQAVFEALYNRRTVATTGARMLLTYHLNGSPLGSEVSLKDRPEWRTSRKLTAEFHGTAPLAQIDIVRNNKIVHTCRNRGETDMRLDWQDTEPIDRTWMPPAKYCKHPFTFYYVRVIQADGEVAWASPVWIDP